MLNNINNINNSKMQGLKHQQTTGVKPQSRMVHHIDIFRLEAH